MSDLHCVFCNITELSKPAVAFLTELGTLLVNPIVNMHVVFDVIHLNDGNGYNNVHGIFTAPVAGIYHFTMALTARRLRVIMMKSNTPIAAQYLDDKTDRWLKQSATVIVHLVKGDDVWVKVTEASSGSNIYGCCYTSIFSGFLIRQDWEFWIWNISRKIRYNVHVYDFVQINIFIN